MLTREMLQGILDKVTYLDWAWEIQSLGYQHIEDTSIELPHKGWLIQCCFRSPCADTGVMIAQKGRKWYVSPHAVTSEVVRTCFLAVQTAMEHEIRECFRYNGAQVFGPHIAVAALEEVAGRKVARVGSGPTQD